MDIVDDAAAIAEIKGLSLNAQRYLMDKIGNRLQGILFNSQQSKHEKVSAGVNQMIADMQVVGMFELHGKWG